MSENNWKILAAFLFFMWVLLPMAVFAIHDLVTSFNELRRWLERRRGIV